MILEESGYCSGAGAQADLAHSAHCGPETQTLSGCGLLPIVLARVHVDWGPLEKMGVHSLI